MANIIDYTYFQSPPVFIPNLATTPPAMAARLSEVSRYIVIYEKEYLRLMLGDDLYDLMIAAPTAPRFVALKARFIDTTNKISPIANYVYVRYMQDQQQVTTQSGDKETQKSGMVSQVNAQKYANIINQMIALSEDVYDWIAENVATYPEWECGFKFERSYLYGI